MLLSLVILTLLTCAARASDSPGRRPVPAVPTRVSAITGSILAESRELRLETQARETLRSGSLPERGIEGARFWLPDTLETSWTAHDKKLHFMACYSIVLTGRISSGETAPGVIGAAVLSVAKELWDAWFKMPPSRRGASTRDFVADALGIGVAVVIIEWFGE
jgi:hypothetical protein